MARTRTSHIKNMSAGQVADETREWFRVTSTEDVLAAVEAWDEYNADNAAWIAENTGQTPPEHAAVSDPASIAMAERIFVELRFFAVNDEDAILKSVNAPWVQVNSTNCPNLSAGFLGDLLKIFNARRTHVGMDPA